MINYLFTKTAIQYHDSETFIADYGAMSHMVNSEENMTYLKDAETWVTSGDNININGIKRVDWHGYQRCDRKLPCVALSNTALIPGLHPNLFSMTLAIQKVFQVMSEGDTLPPILLKEKIENNSGKGFLLTIKFYKRADDSAILCPNKQKP